MYRVGVLKELHGVVGLGFAGGRRSSSSSSGSGSSSSSSSSRSSSSSSSSSIISGILAKPEASPTYQRPSEALKAKPETLKPKPSA